MKNNESHSDSRTFIKHIWSTAVFLAILIIISFFINNYLLSGNQKLIENLSDPNIDTVYIEKKVQKNSNNIYFENKKKEDSLQRRINHVLDSLNLFEEKLLFMQDNSSSSIDIIIRITDSIDIYRRQTEQLKKEIEEVNNENKQLLQKERENNTLLRKKLNYYEKRLMVLYAISLEVVTYSDGFDKNNRLIETNKAKKIKEMAISFQLSRDLAKNEGVIIEVIKGNQKYFVFNKIRPINKIVKRIFKVSQGTDLQAGTYHVIVYHNNKEHNILRSVIAKTDIVLE